MTKCPFYLRYRKKTNFNKSAKKFFPKMSRSKDIVIQSF